MTVDIWRRSGSFGWGGSDLKHSLLCFLGFDDEVFHSHTGLDVRSIYIQDDRFLSLFSFSLYVFRVYLRDGCICVD